MNGLGDLNRSTNSVVINYSQPKRRFIASGTDSAMRIQRIVEAAGNATWRMAKPGRTTLPPCAFCGQPTHIRDEILGDCNRPQVTDCPCTFIHGAMTRGYRAAWEETVQVTDGTSRGLRVPGQRQASAMSKAAE